MSDTKTTKGRKTPPKDGARPLGRPSTFTQEIADEICARLSEGEPLRQICRDERMPPWQTVYRWRSEDESFSRRIACAREAGFDAIAEECMAIADETAFDTIQGENGERANAEWISRSKLRVETRLKLLAKWDPKRYGDKMDVNHGGQPDNPVQSITRVELVPLKK
jgi:transposase